MVQDYIAAAVQSFFCINLIPMIIKGAGKETPLFSSVSTIIGLAILSITFLTIPLYWSALACALVAVNWVVLAYQRIRHKQAQAKVSPLG